MNFIKWTTIILGCLITMTACQNNPNSSTTVTVPFTLDHNRMLIEAEIQRLNGSWRKAKLWIDTGNPECFVSEALALDLGLDLSAKTTLENGSIPQLKITPPVLRINDFVLDYSDVKTEVMFQPEWLFHTMHNDGNLPATVLKKYHIVFDYPNQKLTIAKPGKISPKGTGVPAGIHPETGIVQIDVQVGDDSLSFAMDNGASYSYASTGLLTRLEENHPDWPKHKGAIGCANIWGWWPEEGEWPVVRLPSIQCGSVQFEHVGLVGLPDFFPGGIDVGTWYSHKSLRPVDGFLGPNAYQGFRVEIDYAGQIVYFKKGDESQNNDMDTVGLTLRPESDGRYSVIGVAKVDGKSSVPDIQTGDILIQIDDLDVTGSTMGTVVDALRGKPGVTRRVVIQREEQELVVEAAVRRFL